MPYKNQTREIVEVSNLEHERNALKVLIT
jgi:hypothetical protein